MFCVGAGGRGVGCGRGAGPIGARSIGGDGEAGDLAGITGKGAGVDKRAGGVLVSANVVAVAATVMVVATIVFAVNFTVVLGNGAGEDLGNGTSGLEAGGLVWAIPGTDTCGMTESVVARWAGAGFLVGVGGFRPCGDGFLIGVGDFVVEVAGSLLCAVVFEGGGGLLVGDVDESGYPVVGTDRSGFVVVVAALVAGAVDTGSLVV